MKNHALPQVDGYDPNTQRTIAYVAAALDDQLRRLRESVAGLSMEALEWQAEPGRNTIGMLLAHIAVAETWWINAGSKGIGDIEQIHTILEGIIGMRASDDGMPLAPDGVHPEVLGGKTLADYLALIDRARIATHLVLRTWTDAELDRSVELRGRQVTPGWILYHVLEHMIAHYGQILLLLGVRQEQGRA